MKKRESIVKPCTPSEAFGYIKRSLQPDSEETPFRIVPLFGSGVSVDAGIPTAAFLCDYLAMVGEIAERKKWTDMREYLRKRGWPHRHDIWSEWLGNETTSNYEELSKKLNELRSKIYLNAIKKEMGEVSPIYKQVAAKQLEREVDDYFGIWSSDQSGGKSGGKGRVLGTRNSTAKIQFTDYRSLLSTLTRDDQGLIDAFFDHFIRNRQPSTTHQFISFLTHQLRMDLFLTTNFDPLIEIALRDEGFNPTVYEIAGDGSIPSAVLIRNQAISMVKLHGGTHSLRTGYDLDDPLPIGTLEEIRGYLRGPSALERRNYSPPLLLVLGYSGSDRRVMDIVSEHVQSWREEDGRPAVLWISRNGNAPTLLDTAVHSVLPSRPRDDGDKQNQPAYVCHYRNANLFLQELYQFLRRQHAVTRTSYRAIVSVPRDLYAGSQASSTRETREKEVNLTSQFQVIYARESGFGTSTVLRDAVFKKFDSTYDVIWIDAADYTTRASLVQQIFDEFARLDRTEAHLTRPLFLRDVDWLERRNNQAADVTKSRRKSETQVAVEAITFALRRGRYLLAIDSLGEFGKPHPSVQGDQPILKDQQDRLLQFLGGLHGKSDQFGLSVVLLALTPMNTEDELTRQLQQIVTTRLSDHTTLVENKDEYETVNQEAFAWNAIVKELKKSKEKIKIAASLTLIVASIFRRPRSRIELMVAFVRYVRIIQRNHDLNIPASLRSFIASQFDGDDETKLLEIAEQALAMLEKEPVSAIAKEMPAMSEKQSVPKHKEWPLISRLEGGFYWMQHESRDFIFKKATTTEIDCYGSKFPLLPPELLAEMYDCIASFAIEDIYKRSHDISAFNEYLHYRVLSIRTSFELEHRKKKIFTKTSWETQLGWLVGAIEGEQDNLLTRGKVTSLIDQIRQAIDLLKYLDEKVREKPSENSELLDDTVVRLLVAYGKLLKATGHSKHALVYHFWAAKVLVKGERKTIFCQVDEKPELSSIDLASPDLSREECSTIRSLAKSLRDHVKKTHDHGFEKSHLCIKTSLNLARLLSSFLVLTNDTRTKIAGPWIRHKNESGETAVKECNSLREKIYEEAVAILGHCTKSIAWLETYCGSTKPAVGIDLVALAETKARIGETQCRLELNRELSRARFSWLSIRTESNPTDGEVNRWSNRLRNIADRCEEQLHIVRVGPATPTGKRIISRTHLMRATAFWHMKQKQSPEQVEFKDNQPGSVSFQRAQSSLERPAAAGDLVALAECLLFEAESRIIKIHSSVGPRAKEVKKIREEILKKQGEEKQEKTKWHRGSLLDELKKLQADLKKRVHHLPVYRRQLQMARNLLDRARPLLVEGRAESRWRTMFDYLCARVHFLQFQLIHMLERDKDLERKELSSALMHVITGLTNLSFNSDRYIVLRRFLDVLEEAGLEVLEADVWNKVRQCCGLPVVVGLPANATTRV